MFPLITRFTIVPLSVVVDIEAVIGGGLGVVVGRNKNGQGGNYKNQDNS